MNAAERIRERSPLSAHAGARLVARRARLLLSLALPLLLLLSVLAAGARARRQDAGERGVGVRPAAVGQLPARAKRYALVVGVDEYADAQIGRLSGAANDARLLADALVERAGFPREQVILLASGEPKERQPTRGQIMRSLSNLARAVPADGLLLFSFAGHGVVRGGRAFLLSSDAQVNGDMEVLSQTALEAAWVRGKIEEGKARQVLLLLDACRDDPRAGRNAPAAGAVLTEEYRRAFDFERRNRGVEAFATLYATAVGGTAYEYKEKRHGYFTWAVVEGLRGGAADARSGEVTLARLVKYVQETVARRVALDLGADYDQRPFADVEGYRADDLVIAVASAALPPRAAETTAEAKTSAAENGGGAKPPGALPTSSGKAGQAAAVKSTKSKEKAGRILLLSKAVWVKGGLDANESKLQTGPFWQKISAKLIAADPGLSTTVAAGRIGRDDLLTFSLRLERGDRRAVKPLPYAVVIMSEISQKSLHPYEGLHIAVVSASLKAFDGDTCETLVQEEIYDTRGFGNTPEQARSNAAAAAAEKFALFVNAVVAAAR